MRESIGGAQVLMICVTILLVIIVVLSASIGYTKAFKARNGLVNLVQKYAKYDDSVTTVLNNSGFQEEAGDLLKKMGYMVSAGAGKNCTDRKPNTYSDYEVWHDNNYNFCLYRYEDEQGNQHYGVETYMYFELPIFGTNDRFSFPLYGETFTFRSQVSRDD